MKDTFYFKYDKCICDKSAQELDKRVPGWRRIYLYPELNAKVDAKIDGGKMLKECRRKRWQLYRELNRARYARSIMWNTEPAQWVRIDNA